MSEVIPFNGRRDPRRPFKPAAPPNPDNVQTVIAANAGDLVACHIGQLAAHLDFVRENAALIVQTIGPVAASEIASAARMMANTLDLTGGEP